MTFKDRRYFGQPPIDEDIASYDARLEADVASALANDAEVDAADVTVTVSDGQVTLAGWVGRPEEIARCTEVALRVPGVAAIHNLVTGDGNDESGPAAPDPLRS